MSIVIPVFNGMAHLPATIDSALAQTYKPLEIVIADGGSTDGSREWLARLDDPRVKFFQDETPSGAAANWTRVCELSQGTYVKLLCQDDLLTPTAIERQVADLHGHPDAVLAVAQRDIVDANGQTVLKRQGCSGLANSQMSGDAAMRTLYLFGANVFGEPLTVLFRRDALIAHLPWSDRLPLMLDVSMYAKVVRGEQIVVRKESVGAFRVSTSSWSTRLAKDQLRQFSEWQRQYASTAVPEPTAAERRRAALGVRMKTAARRGVYAWLSMRGSLRSPHQQPGAKAGTH